MATLLRMPEVSANVESAVIVTWTKAEGEAVAVGECVAEIETDKAVVEFASESAGRLSRILVPAGQEARVGAPVAVLLAPGEPDVADLNALLAGQPGGGSATAGELAASADPQGLPAPLAPAAPVTQPSTVSAASGRLRASPLARRLAAQAGLALQGLSGSGPHGRIVKRDVLAALARNPAVAPLAAPAQAAAVSPAPALAPGDVAVPHTAMRRTIARRLLESKTTIPHFYLRADCRMEALLALRRQINEGGRRISINDIVVKAVALALMEHPDMNVGWTEAALIRHSGVDLSVAVSTPAGLITPVVRGVHDKSLSRVSTEIAALAARARDGKLLPQEYEGGSFTVSNLGMYGTTEFAAIINPPQAAILAVGAVERRVVAGPDDGVQVAPMMTVVLSVDHRAVDGAVAAQWLAAFRHIIENPLAALV
jgi:pyruvate dehydrogenase E2 component (dihydrolipoamide acetyltransferase)